MLGSPTFGNPQKIGVPFEGLGLRVDLKAPGT